METLYIWILKKMSLTNYDKAALEAQLVRVRADYNALNMIQTSVNNSILDSNEKIRQLKKESA